MTAWCSRGPECQHGPAAYNKGCRDPMAVEAVRHRQARYRAAKRKQAAPRRGEGPGTRPGPRYDPSSSATP